MKRVLLFASIVSFAALPLLAQTPWIHVEVDEAGEDQAHVKVNLPLSIVQLAWKLAPEKFINDGHFHLSHVDRDWNLVRLRELWIALRDSGNAELVTIEEKDETVRVRRDGDSLRFDVQQRSGDSPEHVHVEIPVAVVDALFSGEGESLNLEDALAELSTQRGELVRVDDGKSRVRIWIDEKD
jgi:hypothetical protein